MSEGRFKRQASDTFAGPVNEAIAASSAGGGTSLSTTAAVVGLPNNTEHVSVIFRNFAGGAVVGKIALNPYLIMLLATDGLATLANITDFSIVGQQNPDGSGVVLGALAALPQAFYIGAHTLTRGLSVKMGGTINANASVLLVEFWNGSNWVAVSGFTDNTSNGGKTFAQDGTIVWTVPPTAAKALLTDTAALASIVNTQPAMKGTLVPNDYNKLPYFWFRLSVSATLTAATVAAHIFALNRKTTYAEGLENSLMQFRTQKAPGGVASVEMLTDAGTANAIVNCYTDNPNGLF